MPPMMDHSTEQTENPKEEMSALKARNEKYGANSYYFAHNRERDPNAPVDAFADGPRKLATTTTKSKPKPIAITKYAWCDDAENKKVKVYIELEGLPSIEKKAIRVSHTKRRAKLFIDGLAGKDYFLRLNLSNDIVEAKFTKKPNKIILTLIKRNSFKWYDLTTKGNAEVSDDDEEDEEEDQKTEEVTNKMSELDAKLQQGDLTFSDKLGVKGHQTDNSLSGIPELGNKKSEETIFTEAATDTTNANELD
jgi:hypothetical protein